MKKTEKKRTGRPRVLTDSERKEKYEKHLARLKRWKKIHMKDPAYRAELNRRRNERQKILEREAEFGRIARALLQYLGSMMFEVGKPPEPLKVNFVHKTEEEILAGMKRPFTHEQAAEYWELLNEVKSKKGKVKSCGSGKEVRDMACKGGKKGCGCKGDGKKK